MRMKRRVKSSRYRASQTHKRGHRKRTKGSGNRAGKGKAGSGKRGDAKKTKYIGLYGKDYFGKDKALRRGRKPKKLKVINLNDLIEQIDNLEKKDRVKINGTSFEFNLEGYKLLSGDGSFASKVKIKASAASKSAISQVEAAGGSVEILKSEKPKAEESKSEENPKEEKEQKSSK